MKQITHYPVIMLSAALLSACEPGSGNGQSNGEPSRNRSENGVPITLQWNAPTENNDGSCISGLAGYRLYYGLNPSFYQHSIDIDPGTINCNANTGNISACGDVLSCTATLNVDLHGPNTWYLTLQAIDNLGKLSEFSNATIETIN